MPGQNGSGPMGNGRGGRGLGPCGQGGTAQAGRGMGMGRRKGAGQGGRGIGMGGRGGFGGGRFGAGLAAINPFRRGWGGNAGADEKEMLRQNLDELKAHEQVIEQRLHDLESPHESTE